MIRVRRGRHPGAEAGVLFLLLHLLDVGITQIPIVTLFCIAFQALLYAGFIDPPWNKNQVCISPYRVIMFKDYKTLILGTLEHGHDMHLYFNMVSFLVKGRTLEKKYGSANFAILLVLLTFCSSSLFVLISYVGAVYFQNLALMKTCAIGFSGVIFALKVIKYKEEPHEYITVFGVGIPSSYAAWAELILIHIFAPNTSFIGHLAGILAGVIYCSTILGKYIDKAITRFTGVPFIHTSFRFVR